MEGKKVRDYGLCLWTFGNISLEEKCKLAKEIGVTGVEVQGDLSQEPSDLKATLRKFDLKLLSVTPDNFDISSNDEHIRTNAIQYFLDLLSWANEVGAKRICLHGEVGKIKGTGEVDADWNFLVKSSREILKKAEKKGIEVVFEVLNRYENHQIVTAEEALHLIDEVGSPNLKVLLDSYHMNIEESSPIKALREAGDALGMYHIADSNRQGIGRGHANLKDQIIALNDIGYKGPIIMEMMAEGPNPFTPMKDGDYVSVVVKYYKESLRQLKGWEATGV